MKLLLDEHIWPGVADLIVKQCPAAEVASLHHHNNGSLLNSSDDEVLAEAHRGKWTLVTFDVNTIPALLRDKAMANEEHSGVIFISSKSFAQNDHTRFAQALSQLFMSESGSDWSNRVMFLSRRESMAP